jgi:very-short-patch-repair endonuclease
MDEITVSVFGVDHKIKTASNGTELWYCAKDIQRMLDLKNIREFLSRMPTELKGKFKTPTFGGAQTMVFLSESGFMDVLSRTRSIHSVEIAKQLGMNVTNHVHSCEERDMLVNVAKAFHGETMYTQHTVLKYKIDLYFPKYNLAIEFDEKFHKKQLEADQNREVAIHKEIGCTFIRFSIDDDVFCVINRIFRHIHDTSTL